MRHELPRLIDDSGSVVAAQRIIDAIERGDLHDAWAMHHPDVRKMLAADWVVRQAESSLEQFRASYGAIDEVHAALAEVAPEGPAWEAFSRGRFGSYSDHGVSYRALGAARYGKSKTGELEEVVYLIPNDADLSPGAEIRDYQRWRFRLTRRGWFLIDVAA